MNLRLTKLDQLHLSDHYYLDANDTCFYCGEYTARRGPGHSTMNQLIYNLKKGVDRANCSDYQYKTSAILSVAKHLASLKGIENYTLIPVPPSKCKADPLYDDRLIKILERVSIINEAVSWRELIVQNGSYQPSHLPSSSSRPNPDVLANRYAIDFTQVNGIRQNLIIFDDVLTAGSHFKAIQRLINENIQVDRVIGLFIARTERDSELSGQFD